MIFLSEQTSTIINKYGFSVNIDGFKNSIIVVLLNCRTVELKPIKSVSNTTRISYISRIIIIYFIKFRLPSDVDRSVACRLKYNLMSGKCVETIE